MEAGHNVTVGSYSSGSGPIVGSHAYTVMSAETVDGNRTITVYNPWSTDGKAYDDNPDDGLLKLSLEQFKDAFAAVTVSLA